MVHSDKSQVISPDVDEDDIKIIDQQEKSPDIKTSSPPIEPMDPEDDIIILNEKKETSISVDNEKYPERSSEKIPKSHVSSGFSGSHVDEGSVENLSAETSSDNPDPEIQPATTGISKKIMAFAICAGIFLVLILVILSLHMESTSTPTILTPTETSTQTTGHGFEFALPTKTITTTTTTLFPPSIQSAGGCNSDSDCGSFSTCCSGTCLKTYDDKICCGGKIYDRYYISNSGLKMSYICCGDQVKDLNLNTNCCNGVIYNINIQSCCNGIVYQGHHRCCSDNICPEGQECCENTKQGSICYDPLKKYCIGG